MGVAAMSAKAVWKAVRVGRVEEDHERGSARTDARRGSEESAGRESIMEARKAAGAREVASGREIPPAVAGWSSWKAVSSTKKLFCNCILEPRWPPSSLVHV